MAIFALGIGSFRPESNQVREMVNAAGGDVAKYTGWDQICVASDSQQPSNMAEIATAEALKAAGISAKDLRLVISTGTSYDYLPSWSVALETMKRLGAESSCVGFDMSQGCVAGITAMNLMNGWLESQEGESYGVIICAQKWSHTIDRKDATNTTLWSWGDGATAIIFGNRAASKKPLLEFKGAVFLSHAELHGSIHRIYGGTKHPTAPEGTNPFKMEINSKMPATTVFKIYERAFRDVIQAARTKFGVQAQWAVCNHVSPGIAETIRRHTEVPEDRIVVIGHEVGHVGSSDVIFDIQEILTKRKPAVGDNIFAVSSGQHTWACGVLKVC